MAITIIQENTTRNGSLVGGSSACGGSPPFYTSVVSIDRTRRINSEYSSLVAQGKMLPALAYYHSKTKSVYSIGHAWGGTDNYYHATPCGIDYHYDSFTSQEISDINDECVERLYAVLKSGDNFNLGTALAEMPKTIGLVASTATRIAGSLRNLRRGNIRGAFQSLGIGDSRPLRGQPWNTAGQHIRDLQRRRPRRRDRLSHFAANSWLEMQYGWKPLLGEVYDGATLAAKGLQENEDDASSSFIVSKKKSRNKKTVVGGTKTTIQTGNHELSISYNIKLKVIDPKLRALAALGLSNPLNIAWEILPFSFIVDWFYPVQNFLEASNAMSGYSTTEVTKFKKLSLNTVATKSTTQYHGHSPYGVQIETETGERTVGDNIPPVPKPNFKLSNALGGTRALNALALLRANF